jgi:hypothetical protein
VSAEAGKLEEEEGRKGRKKLISFCSVVVGKFVELERY